MERGFIQEILKKHQREERYPPTSNVSKFITRLLLLLFPEQAKTKYKTEDNVEAKFEELKDDLLIILQGMSGFLEGTAEQNVHDFFEEIPQVYKNLSADMQAILDGDPAATCEYEVVRAYPGFYAIAFYRFAHVLYTLKVPIIPRVITEYAHSKTGIDIHPGAEIAPHFFIDHGTGIVIGETCVIGENVKMYQGVTLGALSVSKDLAQTKRHPTIENNVVIYAGATILGGDTVIGEGSIVGGNVWLTKSIPPFTKIYHQPQVKVHQSNTDINA